MPVNKHTDVFQYLLPLVAFSIAYGIAAGLKPFHVDEFFSWVYAERCSYKDILLLKEFGIGHPPIFHLLQKISMDVFPGCHFIEIRMANYIAGCTFVGVLSHVLARHGAPLVYTLSVSSSAAVLNVFVLARMYGLVCLASVLLLWAGESYVRSARPFKLLLLLGISIFGFLSDYSFALMMPYLFIVLTNGYGRVDPKKIMYSVLVSVLLLATVCKALVEKDFVYLVAYYITSIPRVSFEMLNALLNFWFLEPFFAALLITSAVLFLSSQAKDKPLSIAAEWNSGHLVLLSVFFFAVVEGMIRFTSLQARHMAIFILLFALGILICHRQKTSRKLPDVPARLLHSVGGGALILLAVNQFFWRDLRDARFLSLLLPFYVLLMLFFLNQTKLHSFSAILFFSGVIFITSNGLGDYFPPPYSPGKKVDFYQTAYSYSTRYLKTCDRETEEPVFVESGLFWRYCQLCKLGKSLEGTREPGQVVVMGWHNFDVREMMSYMPGVVVKDRRDVGLSHSDEFQFKHLTPIYSRRHSIFSFEPALDRADSF